MYTKSHMNAMANSKNAFQGNAKRILTICSAGLLRSPTAATVLSEAYGYNCRAAGCVPEYALVPVTEVLIYWADEIVFMEEAHLRIFRDDFAESKIAMKKLQHGEFQVLNIPDSYSRMDETLVSLIMEKYQRIGIDKV